MHLNLLNSFSQPQKQPRHRLLLLLAVLFPLFPALAAPVINADICIYGATSGGIASAIQASRMGKSVALAAFNTHLGGLTTGGLGATDVGNIGSIGGISREFYRRVGQHYGSTESFKFEPKVARQIFETWLAEVGITPRWNQRLASVGMTGNRITEIRMEDGTIYRARMFIDATYEGDLMALAGVPFTFGRESVATYGESLNGIRASTPAHQFTVNVDPYATPGVPASGLLPFIAPGSGGTPGDGDHRIQAYNYRLCFTQNSANRLPHVVPPDYDPARYELLGRLLDARIAAGHTLTMGSFFGISSMPNGKTDMNNNGAFSTDFIGMNYTYPTNSHAARAQIDRAHLEYIQGLIYYLATSPRSPASLRAEVLSWGPTRDEWTETGGYSPQIYVREARRMISDYVITQADCQSARIAPDPVALGSYNMDSHNCQRIVQNGYARNEGDVQVGVPRPYPISYRSIIPPAGHCDNLFITFAISASHIAFGSTRMEPVFMMLGQSAATAAAFAIDDNLPVQEVNFTKLSLQLLADAQVLYWGNSDQSSTGIILDAIPSEATIAGTWETSTSVSGFWGTNYLHDQSTGKGTKSVSFHPNLPDSGPYQVYLRWTTHANRATNVPVDILHAQGKTTLTVNQTLNNATWVHLLTTNFNAGTNAQLVIRTDNTTGYVIADAARWLHVSNSAPPVQILATDPIASETGKTARVTFIRPADQSSAPLTIRYSLGGTTSNGVDYALLPGSLLMPAGVFASNLVIRATPDTLPEGDRVLQIALEPAADYTLGALNQCTLYILDDPFDAWRFAHFKFPQQADPAISGLAADPDSDTQSNWQEYLAGTLPLDPSSVFRLGIRHEFQAAILSFAAGSNRTYTIHTRDHLTTDDWFALTNFASAPTNRVMIYEDPREFGLTNRLYRLSAP